ncbi:pyridoxal kinase [Striga asiatica]|uniref:pyridoxal kinase n=1 Tax=Striga asiatica TaxID=4170 RepID=A0A5A7QT34_STRAF|nr:pyridoxal kinase [Striga asiatica]
MVVALTTPAKTLLLSLFASTTMLTSSSNFSANASPTKLIQPPTRVHDFWSSTGNEVAPASGGFRFNLETWAQRYLFTASLGVDFLGTRVPNSSVMCVVVCQIQEIHGYRAAQGYPTFKGQVLNGDQLWDLIEGLEANNLSYYTHLLTGYIGSVSFLNTVLKVIEKLRAINPGLTYVCDPVLGDEGKLYVPQEMVSVYREKVVPVASMLTPNQFEAELLTGSRILSEQDGREACNILHASGPSKVVITSINIDGNLLLIGSHRKDKGQPPAQFRISIPKIPAYFTGTGDLMTALLLGWSNKYPNNLGKAAELSVSSLQALLVRTVNDYTKAGHDCRSSSLEIRLIQSQDVIRKPEIKYKAEIYN